MWGSSTEEWEQRSTETKRACRTPGKRAFEQHKTKQCQPELTFRRFLVTYTEQLHEAEAWLLQLVRAAARIADSLEELGCAVKGRREERWQVEGQRVDQEKGRPESFPVPKWEWPEHFLGLERSTREMFQSWRDRRVGRVESIGGRMRNSFTLSGEGARDRAILTRQLVWRVQGEGW